MENKKMFKITRERVIIIVFLACNCLDSLRNTSAASNQTIISFLEQTDPMLMFFVSLAFLVVIGVVFALDWVRDKVYSLVKKLVKYNYKGRVLYTLFVFTTTAYGIFVMLQH
jgi:hypothetical protein